MRRGDDDLIGDKRREGQGGAAGVVHVGGGFGGGCGGLPAESRDAEGHLLCVLVLDFVGIVEGLMGVGGKLMVPKPNPTHILLVLGLLVSVEAVPSPTRPKQART